MATRSDPPPSRGRSARLALWALAGAAAAPASAHVDAERVALDTRVAAVRAALRQIEAGTSLGAGPTDGFRLAAQAATWTNWPKWSKWSNWANK